MKKYLKISTKGLTEILNSQGYRDIPEEDSKELFNEIDLDKDCLVIYEEYIFYIYHLLLIYIKLN